MPPAITCQVPGATLENMLNMRSCGDQGLMPVVTSTTCGVATARAGEAKTGGSLCLPPMVLAGCNQIHIRFFLFDSLIPGRFGIRTYGRGKRGLCTSQRVIFGWPGNVAGPWGRNPLAVCYMADETADSYPGRDGSTWFRGIMAPMNFLSGGSMSETLAQYVQRYMRLRRISGNRLAKLSRHGKATISRLRQGQGRASERVLVTVARVLNAPETEMLALAGLVQRFPVAGEAALHSLPADDDVVLPRPMVTATGPSPLVLIVDDARDLCELIRQRLAPDGYRTKVAHDGQMALRLLQEELPDLVLLDIEMPEMDGIEFCRRVRANPRTDSLIIIFLTKHAGLTNKQQAHLVGGDDFLPKPYISERGSPAGL